MWRKNVQHLQKEKWTIDIRVNWKKFSYLSGIKIKIILFKYQVQMNREFSVEVHHHWFISSSYIYRPKMLFWNESTNFPLLRVVQNTSHEDMKIPYDFFLNLLKSDFTLLNESECTVSIEFIYPSWNSVLHTLLNENPLNLLKLKLKVKRMKK